MSKIGDYKNFIGVDKNYFTWFAIYITIGLLLSFTTPFPMSLLAYIVIVLILQTCRMRNMQNKYLASEPKNSMKNTKNRGFRGFRESISDTLFGNPYNSLISQPLRFVCMNCKKEHKERSCPKCGSRAVRVE